MAREFTPDALLSGVRAGDRRALAASITLVENGDPAANEIVKGLYGDTGCVAG